MHEKPPTQRRLAAGEFSSEEPTRAFLERVSGSTPN